MTAFAQKEDIPALSALWQAAFWEEESAVLPFFEQRFLPDNTLVIREGDSPVSALYLLDGNLQTADGAAFPAYYIYAAATREDCRKKGYMTALLTKAKELALQRGKAFLTLAPATASLFAYYARFGFESAFYQKKLYVNRRQLRLIARQGAKISSQPQDAQIVALREKALLGLTHFAWDTLAVAYALRQHRAYGGQVLNVAGEDGFCAYALYALEAEKCVVSECGCKNAMQQFPLLADCLLQETQADVFFFTLPLSFPLSADQFEVAENAMLLAVTPQARQMQERLLHTAGRNAYMGLTME